VGWDCVGFIEVITTTRPHSGSKKRKRAHLSLGCDESTVAHRPRLMQQKGKKLTDHKKV
jgi:hypothetical protein